MQISGTSLQGQVALAHFFILLFAFAVYVTFFPIRPSEATPQQIVISESSWTVIAILIFPIGYLGYLLPRSPDFPELQLIWIVLTPLNSCLWGWSAALIQRRLVRLQQTTDGRPCSRRG